VGTTLDLTANRETPYRAARARWDTLPAEYRARISSTWCSVSLAQGVCSPRRAVPCPILSASFSAASAKYLRRWMTGGDSATLRVNAAGILAKMPGQAPAAEVARVLAHDAEAQQFYKTAVLARVGALEWADAAILAADPLAAGTRAPFLAARLATETINPRDAGARWCSAVLLQDMTPLLGWEAAE
jgi:hypothetical protein